MPTITEISIPPEKAVVEVADVSEYREKGNAAFKRNAWDEAIDWYSRGLKASGNVSKADRIVLLRNRSAAHLKRGNAQAARKDVEKVLTLDSSDAKARFRLACALEALEEVESAYKEAKKALVHAPKDKSIEELMVRLHVKVQKKAEKMRSVGEMLRLALDKGVDMEKRGKAWNNLLVLARENAGGDELLKALPKLLKEDGFEVTALRIVTEMGVKNPVGVVSVVGIENVTEKLGVPLLRVKCGQDDEGSTGETVCAAQSCLLQILTALGGGRDATREEKDASISSNQGVIDAVLKNVLRLTTSRIVTAEAREAAIEILLKNVDYSALFWAENFLNEGGVERLLEVASEIPELEVESQMKVTSSTATLASVTLGKVYDNLYHESARKKFLEEVEAFCRSTAQFASRDGHLRVAAAITALLRGPVDVGNQVIGKEGILHMLVVMADSEDTVQQKVAAEAIIAAAMKKDKVATLIGSATEILKKLYTSSDPAVRVRALVGLCKLGSSAGTDASYRPFADGSTLKLAEACFHFLKSKKGGNDQKKWAVEGLSYLTLDAEVKDKFMRQEEVIKAFFNVAETGDHSIVYGVVLTLVNLTNSYDKQEIIPEMIELAKIAKQHVPEEHELDDPEFIDLRIEALTKAGLPSALVALSKTESDSCKEMISRVFNAVCSKQDLRGRVVSAGGVKALLKLASSGTPAGKKRATQALSRIGITMDPQIAFSGQKAYDCVRPLLNNLHVECSALENFEALLALTNLAQMSESVRQRIIKEGGLGKIENYMYEDHEDLHRAAIQAVVNLCMSPDTVKAFEGENDRLKYFILICNEEEEPEVTQAVAGALAFLTSSSEKICNKFLTIPKWMEAMSFLLANPSEPVRERGACIAAFLMDSNKENAAKIVETPILELLMALTSKEVTSEYRPGEKVVKYAHEALMSAKEHGVIQENKAEDDA